ncbi:hypothetical protein MPLB_180057 [Mesorhizobium sp. ORS 3324]|nr:hypothetical protein MPLB_180057 [Mesorhizobium sp. ORS 3324]
MRLPPEEDDPWPTLPCGGEIDLGHIVAISGILLKLPPKLSLEKCRRHWSFGPASYIYSQ